MELPLPSLTMNTLCFCCAELALAHEAFEEDRSRSTDNGRLEEAEACLLRAAAATAETASQYATPRRGLAGGDLQMPPETDDKWPKQRKKLKCQYRQRREHQGLTGRVQTVYRRTLI